MASMRFLSKWRGRAEQSVEVSEKDGVRLLHLGSDTVQSAMRIDSPNDLELAYTQAMMAFLLFLPAPQKLLMVGLGGGSLAKFVYHRLPLAHNTVVEISPQVIAAARAHFFVPPDDDRLSVLVGDAVDYVAQHPECCDVLMLDGFDGVSQVESLSSQDFYDRCAAALSSRGVLVVNLWGSNKRFADYLERIETAFEGRVLCLPAEKRGNIIVFAFRRSPGLQRWDDLREKARRLEADHGLAFLHFVEGLKRMNPYSDKRLLI